MNEIDRQIDLYRTRQAATSHRLRSTIRSGRRRAALLPPRPARSLSRGGASRRIGYRSQPQQPSL